ncbi:MAG: metallopeptidase TldD-related protein, partial [Caldisericales bacterium]|nr:TldD/PmbA family protein [bacterium]
YTNIMRPLEQEFTGMTRDGLFLIENGKIVSGLKNMRVTDSIIRIFAGVEEVENVTRYHDDVVAPAMRSKGIIFSSKTKF